MPNFIAYLAIYCWPLISVWLYLRYSALTATFWTIFGAYMFLPEKTAVDLPLVPGLNKENIAIYSAIFGCFVIKKIRFRLPRKAVGAKILICIGMLIPAFTVLTNLDPVFTGATVKPGLSPQDILSMTLQLSFMLAPFILGALLIKDSNDGLNVLKLIAVAGLIYSPLMIIEVLVSPQLHTWIYGFFPHRFDQQFRFGGYRPAVFMGHGLLVANFSVVVLIAITGLWKAKKKIFLGPNWLYVIYGLFLLIICKSVGPWILGILGLLILTIFSPRVSLLTAFAIASTVVLYPLLAMLDFIPHQSLLDAAAVFGPDKVGSLGFRFSNEELMLAHGRERILFGWGGWARNRIDGVIPDGYWIITFTQFGLFGYLVFFGLPLLAVKKMREKIRAVKNKDEQYIVATFGIMIAMLMVDQIPNASQQNWVIFIYGAAIGFFAQRRSSSPLPEKTSQRQYLSTSLP